MKRSVTMICRLAAVLPLLLLLTLGGSVGLEHCACTDEVDLYWPGAEGCCGGETDCMDIALLSTDDYVVPASHLDFAAPLVWSLPAVDADLRFFSPEPRALTPACSADAPPQRVCLFSMVMRV